MNRDELVRAACRGDVEARNAIGPWLQDELWSFFARCFSDRDRIAELVQATMLDVWTKAPQQQPASADAFLRWVLGFGGMAAKAARTRQNREIAREAKLALLLPAEPSRSPSGKLALSESLQLVERCLERLPTPYRAAVRHRLAGGDVKEFAAEHGITVGTAWWRYSEAVRRIEQLIEHERVTPTPYAS